MVVEDRSKEIRSDPLAKYIIHTPDSQKLISLRYGGVPKTSPAFKGVLHEVSGSFGEMDLNVNRVTIASLLHWLQLLQRTLAEVLPAPPAPTSTEVTTAQVSPFSFLNTGVNFCILHFFFFVPRGVLTLSLGSYFKEIGGCHGDVQVEVRNGRFTRLALEGTQAYPSNHSRVR